MRFLQVLGVRDWSPESEIKHEIFISTRSPGLKSGVGDRRQSYMQTIKVIAGLTCSDHFGMNRPWDFLIRRSFYENTFPLPVLIVYVAPSFL